MDSSAAKVLAEFELPATVAATPRTATANARTPPATATTATAATTTTATTTTAAATTTAVTEEVLVATTPSPPAIVTATAGLPKKGEIRPSIIEEAILTLCDGFNNDDTAYIGLKIENTMCVRFCRMNDYSEHPPSRDCRSVNILAEMKASKRVIGPIDQCHVAQGPNAFLQYEFLYLFEEWTYFKIRVKSEFTAIEKIPVIMIWSKRCMWGENTPNAILSKHCVDREWPRAELTRDELADFVFWTASYESDAKVALTCLRHMFPKTKFTITHRMAKSKVVLAHRETDDQELCVCDLTIEIEGDSSGIHYSDATEYADSSERLVIHNAARDIITAKGGSLYGSREKKKRGRETSPTPPPPPRPRVLV